MTESITQQTADEVRAAMEAELSGFDAIARFRFDDDFKIHHFGDCIDSIPSISPEYTQSLRKIAGLINEPDTEGEALNSMPSFSFPASQERYVQLREVSDLDEYLRFSQSQSTSSQLHPSGTSQASSSASSLRPPAPNQQANQERLNSSRHDRSSSSSKQPQIPHLRKSPRPTVPRVIPGYFMENTEGGQRRADTDNRYTSHVGLLQLSTSEEETVPKSPARSKVTVKSKVKSKDKGKGKRRASSGESSDPDAQDTSNRTPPPRKKPFRLSTSDLKDLDRASRIPDDEPSLVKYEFSWKEKGITKEKWRCLSCTNKYTASKAGHNSNLISHRAKCKGPVAGIKNKVVDLTGDDSARTGKSSAAISTITAASSVTLAGSSYRGPSLSGWIGGQQVTHPLLTRRLGLVAVIQNALPFQHLNSPAIVKLIKSIDARAVMSLRSNRTVRRDLTTFYAALKSDVHQELQGIDTLLSIQHDAWTTKGYQHSFVAMIASYVNSDWQYREVLLSFDVIKAKHTGATFSGHLVRTLADYDLDNKWYGPVTSDSTGVNHRMLDVLQYDLSEKELQQRTRGQGAEELEKDPKASPSSFPKSSSRRKGRWLAEQNKILCLNHHVNIAVRAGFARFGIKFKAKAKNKILDLRPKPPITVTDENGVTVELEEEDEGSEGDGDQAELEDEMAGGPASEGNDDEGNAESMDEDGSDSESESDDEDAEDEQGMEVDLEQEASEDEDEYRSDMEPSPSELGSEDEGGIPDDADPEPVAAPSRSGSSKSSKSAKASEITPTSAIAKLEAFTVDIHRSPQRRDQFRTRMEKEYHKKPKKANARFPPKPNGTRWNSHWSMIKAALKIRDAIDAHCRAYIGSRSVKFGKYLLSDSQWRQLELLKPILALASAVTKSMERAEGTLYMVLDHHVRIEHGRAPE
ncbi:hypothetical protein CF319_g6727 [Tilletia indica]|nr:hypothetical protein CF319_g6727 [Tilletia indica]